MSTRANERYTHGHHESVLRAHSWRTVENSAKYLEPELHPGRSLLDIGCGPGTITIDFAGRLSSDVAGDGRVVGMDAAEAVLAGARALALDAGVANVEFVSGDAYDLPFDDDTFDIVHAHQVLQHLADPVAVLREMARVTKPGGVVAARDVDYVATAWFPELPGLDLWMSVYVDVHRANGGEPAAGRRLRSWALAAGLGTVESTGSVWSFASPAERDWWGGAWAERALASGFAMDALRNGFATRAELEQISGAWLDWAGSADGTFLMPHGELLARV